MAKVDRVPLNTMPQKLAFDRELGPWFREILTILWQQRERSGGDSDSIADLLERIAIAELDIDDLQDADIALDGRIDALEAAPGAYADSIEVNFTSPVYDAQFTITDVNITGASIVMVTPGGASTGIPADEWQMDGASIGVVPASGSATCYVTFFPGPIVGRRTFNYTVI